MKPLANLLELMLLVTSINGPAAFVPPAKYQEYVDASYAIPAEAEALAEFPERSVIDVAGDS